MGGATRGVGRVVGAALACLALAGACGGPEETGGTPEETGGTPPDETPLALQLPASGSARCGVPDPGVLSRADHAFDGTVDAVSGADVTLEVDSWFTGGERDTVLVTTLRGARSTARFPTFARGERYLVAASGTEVMVCGYTDRWRPALETLYQEAFGRQ